MGTGGTFLDLDASRMDYGSVTPGTTTVGTFTLTNRGGSTSGVPSITMERISVATGVGATLAVSGCSAPLPPHTSCVLTISVTPTVLGLFQAFVHIAADPGTSHTGSPYLSIYIVGRAVGFEVSGPSTFDLGDVAPGVTIKRSAVVTALVPLSDLEVRTSGDVSLDAATTTCTASLAQGASCVVDIAFASDSVGWKRGMCGIRAGGDYGQMASIEITANVSKAHDLAIDPKTRVSFVCPVEKTSPPAIFTITNMGSTTSGNITASISGTSERDFRVAETDCTVLAPGATCTVSVVCSPPMTASSDTRNATLSITDGSTNLSVPLSGEVIFPW
jgi:hypothetical protein